MEVEVLSAGDRALLKKGKPRAWSRRSLQRHLGIAIATLYHWEDEMHPVLKSLPKSFEIWKFRLLAKMANRDDRPPLSDYQIECLMLLSELRESAASNETIAQTVKNNELSFFEIHERT